MFPCLEYGWHIFFLFAANLEKILPQFGIGKGMNVEMKYLLQMVDFVSKIWTSIFDVVYDFKKRLKDILKVS